MCIPYVMTNKSGTNNEFSCNFVLEINPVETEPLCTFGFTTISVTNMNVVRTPEVLVILAKLYAKF